MMSSVDMRGASFISMLESIEELRGSAIARRVVEEFPTTLRTQVESGAITRVGWYPMRDFAALHAACDRVVGGGEPFAFELGRVGTDRDLRGLLRFILSITSPDLLTRHADKIMLAYVRGVTGRVERHTPTHSSIFFEGLVGANRLVHAGWAGGIHRMIERCGGEDVSVERQARGDDVTFEIRWR